MNAVGGYGTGLILASAWSFTGTVALHGIAYYTGEVESEGGGVALALLRYGVTSLGQAQDDQTVPVSLMDSTLTEPKVGVSSPTIQTCTNGAAWASMNDGTWAEVGHGLYTVTFDAVDTADLGWIILRVKAADAAETHVHIEVSITPAERRVDYIRGRAQRSR